MGRLFDRFTSNSTQKSAFHSSGLTDPGTRQIGGGVSGSFRQRMAVRRQIVQRYRNSTIAQTTYRTATGVGSKTYQQSCEDAAKKEDLRQSFSARTLPAESTEAARHAFTEPNSRSRDPLER